MSEPPDNLVLALLLDIRASQQRMEDKLDELVRPVSSRESDVAQFHVDLPSVHVDLAAHSAPMDRLDQRLDRIEKRLNLIDV